MKLILNVLTSFEGESLKPGDETDVSQKIAERWINRGIAHYPVKEQKGGIVDIPIELHNDLIINQTQKDNLEKIVKKKSKRKRKKKSKIKGWKVD